jgi:hypothetical protein
VEGNVMPVGGEYARKRLKVEQADRIDRSRISNSVMATSTPKAVMASRFCWMPPGNSLTMKCD